jgi:hypothetical protein
MATKKKVTKSKSVKPSSKTVKSVSKKSKSIKIVQAYRDGFKKPTKLNPLPYFRYANVSISDVSNEKFPEMVQITNGPTKYREIMGKKYVNLMYAKLAVDEIQAYSLIGKGEKSVKDEMEAAGILPLDNELVG